MYNENMYITETIVVFLIIVRRCVNEQGVLGAKVEIKLKKRSAEIRHEYMVRNVVSNE